MKNYDIIIIGGGAAGLAAAITLKKEGINSILLIEKSSSFGGILNQCIHSGFGLGYFKEELTGPEYAYRFYNEFINLDIDYMLNTTVIDILKSKKIIVSSKNGVEEISFKSLIYAAGCYERGAGEIKLSGDRVSGILTAGQAQNYLNNQGYLVGKNIFILGSGDIGLIMARRMTLEGAKVIGVAEIMPYSNGLARNVAQCLDDYNIPLYLSTTVYKTIGKNRLEKIVLAKVDERLQIIEGSEREIECDTLLLSVGLVPNIPLLNNLNLDVIGERIKINENLESSMPGVFICGNCLHVHDLVDNVTLEAINAAKNAALYLNGLLKQMDKNYLVTFDSNFGYVLPNLVSNYAKHIDFKFRAKKHMQNVTVFVKCKDRILNKKFYQFLIPSEMEIISLDVEFIDGEISLEIIKK